MKPKLRASDLDQDDAGSEMIVPSEAGGTPRSSVQVSMDGLVNYMRTEDKAMNPKDKQKSSVAFSSDSKKVTPTVRQASNRELPPPSPFSKQRTFPPPTSRQSRRSIKEGDKNASAKQRWRQRNKRDVNVGSMVDDVSDDETDEEIDEEEDDLVVPKSKSESEARLTRSISNDDLESKSTASSSFANWGGTLGTSSQMD